MNCPRCANALRDIKGVHVCMSCGGAFLAASARDTIAKALDNNAQSTASLAESHGSKRVNTAAKAPCPQCAKDMQRFAVGPVEVDTCLEHGTWYDRGELQQVRDALLAGAGTAAVEIDDDDGMPLVSGSIDLAREPERKAPPPPENRGGFIDDGALNAIKNLQEHEKKEARRERRWRRGLRPHSGIHMALDLLGDIISSITK
jgi:Zn-finger nucleic acid-binding protein